MKLLQIHPSDDMAVALTHLKSGQGIEIDSSTLSLLTNVPAKYKVYLRNLPVGSHPKLYGMPAGRTTRAVRRGEAAKPENLTALRDDVATLTQELSPWQPPRLRGLTTTFQGYRRPDGKVGTRNHLLVVYTVICTQQVAERVVSVARRAFGFEPEDPWVDYARGGSLPVPDAAKGYDGIDEIVLLNHGSGCGMADHGDPEALLNFMAGYINHPNVAGAIVLGLGCEKTPIQKLRTLAGDSWKPIIYLSHQSCGNEDILMRSSIDALKDMLPVAASHKREELPVSSLVLGLECGGSDGFSGITANPALGVVSELVVAQKGGVMLPETPEMFGGETLLAARAVNPEVGRQVLELVRNYASYAAQSGTHLAENPSLGNVREGLTTVQIKSLGAIQKAGHAPVSGVLAYTEPIPGPGFFLLDTPGYDIPSTSALAASAANIIVFTTGMGTPTGNPITPVIKVTTNQEISRRMPDIIDFDAGSVQKGETLEEAGRRMYQLVLEVTSGRITANERLGHRESAFWNRQVML